MANINAQNNVDNVAPDAAHHDVAVQKFRIHFTPHCHSDCDTTRSLYLPTPVDLVTLQAVVAKAFDLEGLESADFFLTDMGDGEAEPEEVDDEAVAGMQEAANGRTIRLRLSLRDAVESDSDSESSVSSESSHTVPEAPEDDPRRGVRGRRGFGGFRGGRGGHRGGFGRMGTYRQRHHPLFEHPGFPGGPPHFQHCRRGAFFGGGRGRGGVQHFGPFPPMPRHGGPFPFPGDFGFGHGHRGPFVHGMRDHHDHRGGPFGKHPDHAPHPHHGRPRGPPPPPFEPVHHRFEEEPEEANEDDHPRRRQRAERKHRSSHDRHHHHHEHPHAGLREGRRHGRHH